MTDHLSAQLLERYQQPDISPEELLTIDQHLETCDVCRERLLHLQLASLRPPMIPVQLAAPAPSLRAASASAARVEADHLTYEQMAAFVKGELSVEEHRQTEAHLKHCIECAWQVGQLREFAATINAHKSYQPPVSAWEKFRALWRAPQSAEALSAPLPASPRATMAMPVPSGMPSSRPSFFRRPILQGAVAFALLLVAATIVWQLRKPATQVVQQFPSATPSLQPTATQEPNLGSPPATTPPSERTTPAPRTDTPSIFAMTLAPLRARGSAGRAGSFNLPATTTDVKVTLTEIVKADADGNPYQRYVVALDQQARKLKTNVIAGGKVDWTFPAGVAQQWPTQANPVRHHQRWHGRSSAGISIQHYRKEVKLCIVDFISLRGCCCACCSRCVVLPWGRRKGIVRL